MPLGVRFQQTNIRGTRNICLFQSMAPLFSPTLTPASLHIHDPPTLSTCPSSHPGPHHLVVPSQPPLGSVLTAPWCPLLSFVRSLLPVAPRPRNTLPRTGLKGGLPPGFLKPIRNEPKIIFCCSSSSAHEEGHRSTLVFLRHLKTGLMKTNPGLLFSLLSIPALWLQIIPSLV